MEKQPLKSTTIKEICKALGSWTKVPLVLLKVKIELLFLQFKPKKNNQTDEFL